MARIRSVKPELRTSRTVGNWPIEVRYAWVLLWGYLDDYGRGVDHVRLITNDLFPLDKSVTERKVDRWLDLMCQPGPDDPVPPLCRYEVEGVRYLHAVKWRDDPGGRWRGHQRPAHPTPSRIPPCPTHERLASGSRTIPEPLANDSGAARDTLANDSRSRARPRIAPAEQGAGSREIGAGSRDAQARGRGRDPSASGGPPGDRSRRAEELEPTARHPATHELLGAFEAERGTRLLGTTRGRWVDAIDRVLDEAVPADVVAAALRRAGSNGKGPALLADLVEDIRGQRRMGPIGERDPADVADDELTPEVLDELLGPDVETPEPPPDEIEQAPADRRRAWFAEQRETRLQARRELARAELARRRSSA